MRTRFRCTAAAAVVVMGIGLFGDPGLSHAVPPAGLPDAAPPYGLPASAPPFGTGIGRGKGIGKGLGKGIGKGLGKGKGHAVARVSYQCLGGTKQISKVSSPYSYVTEIFRAEAGKGQYATLEGGATADLVTDVDPAAAPTHMAAASIRTNGLLLKPFDSCGTSAHSELTSVAEGVNTADPGASGTAYVLFLISINGLRLETQAAKGSKGVLTASTKTSLSVLGLPEKSFTVTASGEIIDMPAGMEVTDLSKKDGDHYVYEVHGTEVVPGTLNFGPGIKNVIRTEFAAFGKISGKNTNGPTIAAGYASAEAVNTIAIEIQSLDPSVSFRFVPVQ